MTRPSPWFRFPHRRPVRERHQLFLAALLGVALAVFLIHRFDAGVRPRLVGLAEAQVRNQLTLIADQAVASAMTELGESYDNLVTLHSGPSGVTAVTANAPEINLLKSAVLEDIVTQVENLDSHSISIPLGALTGLDLLSGLGPRLPAQVLSVASAHAELQNDFISAGINQTLHRILLDVAVTAKLLLPGGIVEVELSTLVCVAETVLVGEVPQTYFQLAPAG